MLLIGRGYHAVLAAVWQALGWHNALNILGKFFYAGHIVFALLYIPVGMVKPPKVPDAAGKKQE